MRKIEMLMEKDEFWADQVSIQGFVIYERRFLIDGELIHPYPEMVMIQRQNEPVRFEINGRPIDSGCEVYYNGELIGVQPSDWEFPRLIDEREDYVSRYANQIVEELIRSVGL